MPTAPTASQPTTSVSPLAVVGAVTDTLARLTASLDPASLSEADAARLVVGCAAIERLAGAAKLLAAGRVAAGTSWSAGGAHRTPADWLAATTTCGRGEARRVLGAAERLAGQPQLESAARTGDLSVDQVALISEAAAADPTAEAELVDAARVESLAGLRNACAARTAAARPDHPERSWVRRRLTTTLAGAEWGIAGTSTPEAGTIVEAALAACREVAFRAGRAAGRRDGFAAYNADALEILAASLLGVTPTCLLRRPTDAAAPPDREKPDHAAGNDDGTAVIGRPPATVIPWDPTPTGSALPGGRRVKVIVRVDHAALVRGHTRAGETCDIAGLGPIPVASVVRLLATGDPFLTAVVTRGTDVASVAHLGRRPTAHQQTALEWRDARCVIAGCTNRFCDIDHNEGWAITHDTRTGDLALLCTHCHARKSAGWRLEGTGTRRRLLPPTGRPPPRA